MLKRKHGYLLGAAIAVLALYSYLWSYTAEKLEQQVVKETANLQEKGVYIGYDAITVSGYPFEIRLNLRNFRLELSNFPSGFELNVFGDLILSKRAFTPTEIVTYQTTGSLEFKSLLLEPLGLKDFVLKARSLEGVTNVKDPLSHLIFTFKDWSFLGYSGDQLDFSSTQDKEKHKNKFALYLTDIDPGHQILAGMPEKIVEMGLSCEVSNTVPFKEDYAQTIKEWQDNNGVFEISRMVLDWGIIDATGDGTLVLDDQLNPIVAISLNIVGLDRFVDVLVQNGLLKKNTAALAVTALSLLKEEKETKDGRTIYHKVALTFQDGELMLGPIKVADFKTPPLK